MPARKRLLVIAAGATASAALSIVVNLVTGDPLPGALEPLTPWLWPILVLCVLLSAGCTALTYDWGGRSYRDLVDIMDADELRANPYTADRAALIAQVEEALREEHVRRLSGLPALPFTLHDSPESVGDAAEASGPRTALRAYDDGRQSLLVLGAPGAGKSTLLAELAEDLLHRARTGGEDKPIPVLVPLAEWGRRRRWRDALRRRRSKREDEPVHLGSWLVWYLNKQYGLPPSRLRAWIALGRLALLFDGLDEVRPDIRAKCAKHLDAVARHGERLPMVVTCRQEHYGDLPEPVRLRAAVTIAPLTREQVHEGLGTQAPGLRAALKKDPGLWELLDSPLWLQIAYRVYRDAPGAGPALVGSPARRRGLLLDAYVCDVLERRRSSARRDPTTTLRAIIHLARLSKGADGTFVGDLGRMHRTAANEPAVVFPLMSLVMGPLMAAVLVTGLVLPLARPLGLLPTGVLAVLFGATALLAVMPGMLAGPSIGLPPQVLGARPARRVLSLTAAVAVGVLLGVMLTRAGAALAAELAGWNRLYIVLSVLVVICPVAYYAARTRSMRCAALGLLGAAGAGGVLLFPVPRAEFAAASAHTGLVVAVLVVLYCLAPPLSERASGTNNAADNLAVKSSVWIYVGGCLAVLIAAALSGAPVLRTLPSFLLGAFGVAVLVSVPAALAGLGLRYLLRPSLNRLLLAWLGILPVRLRPFLRELEHHGLVNRVQGRRQFMHVLMLDHLAGLDPYDSVHTPAPLEEPPMEALRAAPPRPAGHRVPHAFLRLRADLLEHPLKDGERTLRNARDLAELSHSAHGRLVIVDGAGTNQAADVLGELAAAEWDDERLPVILDASTWQPGYEIRLGLDAARPHRSITRWILRSLRDAHGDDPIATLRRLASGRLSLLLRGFDDLPARRRRRFKASLNEFRSAYPALPVTLACSEKAYRLAGDKLYDGLAVEITSALDRGSALLESGDFPAAIASYRDRLAADEPSLADRQNYAHALHMNGDLEEAVRQYRAALAAAPDYTAALEIRISLAESLQMLGLLEEAEAEHREAFDGYELFYGPGHPETRAQRGRLADVLELQGKFDESWTLLHGHDDSDPDEHRTT
ncbi:tetratricopeptide repeat protein [Nonomuraea sp. NPDC049419]|uniref:tetratricopeptide repeat protein n=1 Tax=Nonomuraea sp. NPDC049419 TaxID=3155772 RepID=UPI00342076CB